LYHCAFFVDFDVNKKPIKLFFTSQSKIPGTREHLAVRLKRHCREVRKEQQRVAFKGLAESKGEKKVYEELRRLEASRARNKSIRVKNGEGRIMVGEELKEHMREFFAGLWTGKEGEDWERRWKEVVDMEVEEMKSKEDSGKGEEAWMGRGIEKVEIRRVFEALKYAKAGGGDEIPGEVFTHEAGVDGEGGVVFVEGCPKCADINERISVPDPLDGSTLYCSCGSPQVQQFLPQVPAPLAVPAAAAPATNQCTRTANQCIFFIFFI
jgi:hypothetical protein